MLSALLSMLLVFSHAETTAINSCPTPTNFQATPITDGFDLDWDNCICTSFTAYMLRYYRHGVGFSSNYSTGNSYYTFSNLPDGTYDIYLWIDCGGGETSEAIVIEDLISN